MKGQKWPTFTPPATTQCRRYRGRVLLRRLQLETRLKGGDVKPKGKPKSRIGKAIAPPPVPKPNVPQPPTTASSTGGGMPSAVSSATSQADYDRLKPLGSQGTISAS